MRYILTALVLVLYSAFGAYIVYKVLEDNEPDQCIMSWMRPNYIDMEIKDENYKLYYYLTGQNRMKNGQGIPAIFVHGNAGFYKQIRSVGQYAAVNDPSPTIDPSVLAIRNDMSKYQKHLDFYTIDYKEEFSAFSHSILQRQVDFLNRSISEIKKMHKPGTPIIGLGHSMGGLLLRSILKYHPELKLLFHLSAPVIHHPYPLTYDIWRYYHNLHRDIKENVDRESVVEVSVSGGFRDILINYDQTILRGQTFITTEIPSVKISSDHQEIVWCCQFVQVLSNTLLEIINHNKKKKELPQPKEIREIIDSNMKSKLMDSVFTGGKSTFRNIINEKINLKDDELEDFVDIKIEDYPHTQKIENYDKIYSLRVSKKKKVKRSRSFFFMTNLKKGIHFDFFGSIEKNGKITYLNLNEEIEFLPSIKKRERHREVEQYFSRIPKSIFYIKDFTELQLDRIYLKFKKNAFKSQKYGKVKTPIFSYGIAKGEKMMEKDFGFWSKFKFLVPYYSEEIYLTKESGQATSFALELRGLDTSLPYKIGISMTPSKRKCFNPVVAYWLKNEDNAGNTQSRMQVLNLNEEYDEKNTFSAKFFPDGQILAEKTIKIMIFPDPQCARFVDSVRIVTDWNNVIYYLFKFESKGILKLIFAIALFSIVRFVSSKNKTKLELSSGVSPFFMFHFLKDFTVTLLVMIGLRILSKYLVGEFSSVIYPMMNVIISFAIVFVIITVFSLLKIIIRFIGGRKIIIFVKNYLLFFVVLSILFFPTIGYLSFLGCSIIICLSIVSQKERKEDWRLQSQFNEGILLVYFLMSIFHIFPIITYFKSENFTELKIIPFFFELPFFIVLLHSDIRDIRKMFSKVKSSNVEFFVNALGFTCLLVKEKIFVVNFISLVFFCVIGVISFLGFRAEDEDEKKDNIFVKKFN